MIRLRTWTQFPPGEFPYSQTEGISRIFSGDGLSLEQQAKRVSAFRIANKLSRSDVTSCAQDIDSYTCSRLGNDPKWVIDSDAQVQSKTLQAPTPCSGCGAPVT